MTFGISTQIVRGVVASLGTGAELSLSVDIAGWRVGLRLSLARLIAPPSSLNVANYSQEGGVGPTLSAN